ncbi:hypothetical protein H4217_005178 [Coemansia sp. RSA 1939]|nr:hypothetical protein H4217_005178 [Coemansia sp. RSA 1939]KAJ2614342.1 hypothetical protein EV177_002112 [Coemansia sp. RSA 1804]KAJ2682271.1 hypothetical protein GGH99_004811 [Coemansia sp. RSA 1285]
MTAKRVIKLALFSGSVFATGDTIAQHLDLWSSGLQSDRDKTTTEDRSGFGSNAAKGDISGYNPAQTLRFFVYGCMFAPVSYKWHAFLNTRFPLIKPTTEVEKLFSLRHVASSRVGTVLKRVAVDQIVFAPLATGAFIVGMGVLEGQGPDALLERIRLQYPKFLLAGYVVWPAAQLVNFSLVPLAYRVPFGSVVSLFWNTYLSWENARTRRQQMALHGSQSPVGSSQASSVDSPA